jgi:hypothetical protein
MGASASARRARSGGRPMIYAPNGAPLTREQQIAEIDARTLRAYKQILAKYGYVEELWCDTCDESGDAPGCRARVMPNEIRIECRHRRLYYLGSTPS